MGWKEIKTRSKDIVHATFSRPAIYTSPQGIAHQVLARLHNKMEVFGDLDREGFAKRFEETNQVVFDSTQVVPQKKGVVDFGVTSTWAPIIGSDEKYDIVNVTPPAGDRYIKTEVTKQ